MAQSKINKHGLQMINLRKIVSEMTTWPGAPKLPVGHYDVAYDPKEGKIYIRECIGQNYIRWNSEMIKIGDFTTKPTQQELADRIYDAYKMRIMLDKEKWDRPED